MASIGTFIGSGPEEADSSKFAKDVKVPINMKGDFKRAGDNVLEAAGSLYDVGPKAVIRLGTGAVRTAANAVLGLPYTMTHKGMTAVERLAEYPSKKLHRRTTNGSSTSLGA